MKKFSAAVFDFDGTLARTDLDFDLMRTKMAAIAEGFLDIRPEPNGRTVLEWIDELAEQVAIEHDQATGLEFHCRARLAITDMELKAAQQGNLFDFTRPMFETLRKRGIKIGVITRNISPAVLTVFPDLNEYAGSFIPRDATDRVKPDPAHLTLALSQLGVEPDRAIMIGDHPMDITTGKRAGTATGAVGAANTPDSEADFREPDAGALITRLVHTNAI